MPGSTDATTALLDTTCILIDSMPITPAVHYIACLGFCNDVQIVLIWPIRSGFPTMITPKWPFLIVNLMSNSSYVRHIYRICDHGRFKPSRMNWIPGWPEYGVICELVSFRFSTPSNSISLILTCKNTRSERLHSVIHGILGISPCRRLMYYLCRHEWLGKFKQYTNL